MAARFDDLIAQPPDAALSSAHDFEGWGDLRAPAGDGSTGRSREAPVKTTHCRTACRGSTSGPAGRPGPVLIGMASTDSRRASLQPLQMIGRMRAGA